MSSKEATQEKLIIFLEKELEQNKTLESYYQKQLAQLKILKEDKLNLPSPSPSRPPARPKTNRLKSDEVSILEESAISINSSKPECKEVNREASTFQIEYQLLSKEIAKLIDGLANKDASLKKSMGSTPKRKPSFSNKSGVKPPSPIPEFKLNLSVVSNNKTEREQAPPELRERLLWELGDTTQLISNDQVVSKLISNLRTQEERFVDSLLYKSSMSARSKMKNYLEHLAEKNEQTLFKLKQRTIDRSLSRTEFNKETVRVGYTAAMRQVIERGMRKAPAQI